MFFTFILATWLPIIGTGLIVEIFLVAFGVYLYSKWVNIEQQHLRDHDGNNRRPGRQLSETETVERDRNEVKKEEFQVDSSFCIQTLSTELRAREKNLHEKYMCKKTFSCYIFEYLIYLYFKYSL